MYVDVAGEAAACLVRIGVVVQRLVLSLVDQRKKRHIHFVNQLLAGGAVPHAAALADNASDVAANRLDHEVRPFATSM